MKREYYQKYKLTPQASFKSKPVEQQQPKCAEEPHLKPSNTTFFENFENFTSDDLLIMALIIALVTEDEPDFLTIAALVFILLS